MPKKTLPYNTADLIKRGNKRGKALANKFPNKVSSFSPVGTREAVNLTTPSKAPLIKPKPVIQPTQQPQAGGIRNAMKTEDSQQKMVDQILQSLVQMKPPTTTVGEQRQKLREERGIAKLEGQVRSFDEEIDNTFDMIKNIRKDITQGARESNLFISEGAARRRAAAKRAPLLEELSELQRGRKSLVSRLGTEMTDINQILNLRESERTRALQEMSTKLGLVGKIKDLTTETMDEEQRAVMNAVIDKSMDYPEAGITAEDTLTEAGEKIARYKESLPVEVEDRNTKVVDAGNRIELIDTQTGETIRTISKGLTPQQQENDIRDTIKDIEREKESDAMNEGAVATLTGKIQSIDNLLAHKGLDRRVGPNPLARSKFAFVTEEIDGLGSHFAGKVQSLTSQEFLDKLINVKGQGATFGSLDKGEREALKAAATAINAWETKDKNDNPAGEWDVTEKQFKEELNRLKTAAEDAIRGVQSRGGVLGQLSEIAPEDAEIGQEFISSYDGVTYRRIDENQFEEL